MKKLILLMLLLIAKLNAQDQDDQYDEDLDL
jgi:hypothetical protein